METGKPKSGVEEPGGGGAGVEWRVASLAARERGGLLESLGSEEDEEIEGERSKKSVTRKDWSGESAREPKAWDLGQRDRTTEWMALREACSPSNMSAASLPRPVFIK